MEKNCVNCSHGVITGGDFVPYGSTSAQLPDSIECDNPDVPEEQIDELIEKDGVNCPYHSWNMKQAIDDYIHQNWGTETAEILHRKIRDINDGDADSINKLFLKYESEFE